jgi:putative peptide maturation dehydrogenase
MSDDRRVRRCFALFLHSEERRTVDFLALLSGRDAMRGGQVWQALAPHLPAAVDLDAETVGALGRISETRWTPRAEVVALLGERSLRGLIDAGLVLEDGDMTPQNVRDQALRDSQWHPLMATAHAFSRWSGIDSLASQAESRIRSTEDLIAEHGPPPPHFHQRRDAEAATTLPCPPPDDLDALMARRATCRNFDLDAAIEQAELGAILHRTFGVQASEEIAPGAVALKKNHPSGGGLHPLEAYLLLQRAEGLASGLYHYNAQAHRLDRLRAMSPEEARTLAMTMVAGQDYFADAPALLVVAARFARSFWKYRQHPKIYRAILLEAGHASQDLYLAATRLGLGAYITAAINEVEIEQAFGLDALFEGPFAVCGFGPRAPLLQTIELDPLGKVWNGDVLRR